MTIVRVLVGLIGALLKVLVSVLLAGLGLLASSAVVIVVVILAGTGVTGAVVAAVRRHRKR